MTIRVLLPLAAAMLVAGCTLPVHIVETMPDDKLCSVHKFTVLHGFDNDDNTRSVVDAERARRELGPCPEAG